MYGSVSPKGSRIMGKSRSVEEKEKGCSGALAPKYPLYPSVTVL